MAKLYGKTPSQLLNIRNSWAAYQLDCAVTFVGINIDNALQETTEIGTGKDMRHVPTYSLDQLLTPTFKLPRPKTALEREIAAVEKLKAMDGRGVNVIRVSKEQMAAMDLARQKEQE